MYWSGVEFKEERYKPFWHVGEPKVFICQNPQCAQKGKPVVAHAASSRKWCGILSRYSEHCEFCLQKGELSIDLEKYRINSLR